jgi:hypothetical protein
VGWTRESKDGDSSGWSRREVEGPHSSAGAPVCSGSSTLVALADITKRCERVSWIGDSRVGACAPIVVRAHTMEDRRGRSVCSLRCAPVDCTLPRLVSAVVCVREGSHPECETHLHTIDVM